MSAVSATDMSIEARRCHQLFAILIDNGGAVPRDRALKGLQSLTGGTHDTTTRTLEILQITGVVEIEGDIVRLAKDDRSIKENLALVLANELVARFLDDADHDQIAAAFQSNAAGADFWVDSMRLPGHSRRWPITLLNHGVFERESVASRLWRLAPRFQSLFLGILKAANFKTRKGLTPDELSARLRRQEELGKEAEEWVLAFEKRRLAGHALIENVRRLSEEDVGAGYDIISFSTAQVLGHDYFIEVKSYATDLEFYWSDNEVMVSKELGERYKLYLVDRTRLNEDGYIPMIISGPYSHFFEGDGRGWNVEPSSYRITAIRLNREI
jgi:hypothetical protein